MAVFALWSAPRARSTAFFRSMLQRGDLTALHEPFCNIICFGETDGPGGRMFRSAPELLGWLRDETGGRGVFFKDTTDFRHAEVLADRRFLARAHHAFLIRAPEEIAASYYALYPGMSLKAVGLESMHELYTAVRDAGGSAVVLDSGDLAARPEATMRAYCAAAGLPFRPESLTWEPGERPEWRRSARWHADASGSSGFRQRRERGYTRTVENSEYLARCARRHRPFYEALLAERLVVP
ncbi:MAG: sulfotransferase family protein [Streptosporangiales bacterium]|nr:sulfotransferase family protein [Streptosporangiales bacterium]